MSGVVWCKEWCGMMGGAVSPAWCGIPSVVARCRWGGAVPAVARCRGGGPLALAAELCSTRWSRHGEARPKQNHAAELSPKPRRQTLSGALPPFPPSAAGAGRWRGCKLKEERRIPRTWISSKSVIARESVDSGTCSTIFSGLVGYFSAPVWSASAVHDTSISADARSVEVEASWSAVSSSPTSSTSPACSAIRPAAAQSPKRACGCAGVRRGGNRVGAADADEHQPRSRGITSPRSVGQYSSPRSVGQC